MSDFRDAQNQAHPNKTNTLMAGILLLLIGIVGLQIWLLYGTLNNALEGNGGFALATALGSVVLFVLSLFLLKYLPEPRGEGEKS